LTFTIQDKLKEKELWGEDARCSSLGVSENKSGRNLAFPISVLVDAPLGRKYPIQHAKRTTHFRDATVMPVNV
jgi:hypothetical protein